MTRIERLRKIVIDCQHMKVDGMTIDLTTAQRMIAVHDALSPANQEKFGSLPMPRLVDFCWQKVGASA